MVVMDSSTLRCTNLQILNPESYDEHSRDFFMGNVVPPPELRFLLMLLYIFLLEYIK